ncbi:hypothetical protein PQX77_009153 [Marasmius sp. AFHP31]|nr:hypothetical protein PQX77_009153 [Marasmius sp. AFHP31]
MSLLLATLSYRQLGPDSIAPTPTCRGTRTTMDIIWSCLLMIILCTWTSVRPNVPSVPRSGHWALVYWDKAKIFLVAFIAPKLIVLWSARQFLSARKMAKEYQKYGWTITHAFFAIMGGFALYDSDGNFLFHLWDERFCQHFKDETDWDGFSKQRRKLEELVPDGHDQYKSLLEYCVAQRLITMPEEEIENLGHVDILAKTITVLQTLHFITTCIARGVNGLATTELEFFTLAFAALNLVSYSFWWHKPSGVRFPVRVLDRPKTISPDQLSVSESQDEGLNCSLLGTAPLIASKAPGFLSMCSGRIRDGWIDDWDTYNLYDKLSSLASLLLSTVIQSFSHAFYADGAIERPQPERGNIFSGTDVGHLMIIYPLTIVVSVIFGVFHCIPTMLNYRDFPGHTGDHSLWTIFALSTTVLPLGPLILEMALRGCGVLPDNWFTRLVILPVRIMITLSPAYLPLYAGARIGLMVLAAKQLTDLPPSALQQVEWTTLIPHFGVRT